MNEVARGHVTGWQSIVNATHDGVQGFAAGQASPPGISRGLTEQEKAAARSVFGDSLNLDGIQVNDDSFLGRLKDDNAISTPGAVNFPPGTLSRPNDPAYLPWLIHELTHQWQYQHGYQIDELAGAALAAHYDYGGDEGLRKAAADGKGFGSFNFEQQGDILRDYYRRRAAGGDTSAFDPFVRQVQANGPELTAPPRIFPP